MKKLLKAMVGVLPLVLVAGGLLTGCSFHLTEAGSIGIIGGADGPTVIFTTTQLNPRVGRVLWPVVFGGIGVLLFLLIKRKRK